MQHFNTTYPNIVGLLQAPAKRLQHLDATDRSFMRVWPPCCDMLDIENRTSAHAQAQYYCTNLAKRLQHHATPANAV